MIQNKQLNHKLIAWFVLAVLALGLAFSQTLYGLLRFSWSSEFYTYILLVPLFSAGLAWRQRSRFPATSHSALALGLGLAVAGLGVMAATLALSIPAGEDVLSLRMLAFILLFAGICALFWGRERMKLLRFPLAFLLFMLPFPFGLRQTVETFLQYGSAAAANLLFILSGVPVLQNQLTFLLPGKIEFIVEPECSGLCSTMGLLITALLAAHLFLRTGWKKTLFLAAVIPLALLRNGFRIYVIGQLCLHYGEKMFKSWIHLHGGPMFYAISLIPLFGLLLWLVKSERPDLRPGRKVDAAIPA